MTATSPKHLARASRDRSDELLELWQEFVAVYQSEEDCVEALHEIVFRLQKTGCRACGTSAVVRAYGERISKCLGCGKFFSFTAGTFFDRVRLVRPWLAAVWFLERGMAVSAKQFHELAGVAYSTAWMMHRKLALVIQSIMEREKKSFVLVASEVFARAICKRSRETPAKKHPHAEQSQYESSSREHCRFLPDSNPSSDFQNSITALLRDAFHGISRKYLQIYLAEVWCKSDRGRWPIGRLLKECSRHPTIREDEVLSFISPLLVKLIPLT